MAKDFIDILNQYVRDYGTLEEVAEELTDKSDELFQKQGRAKTYSRHIVGRHLRQGKKSQTIDDDDFKCYLEVLDIKDYDRQQLQELYPSYKFQCKMKDWEKEAVQKIAKIFKTFQELSDLKNNPRGRQVYEAREKTPDGLFDNYNGWLAAVKNELIREYNRDTPTIDTFLPPGFDCYYNQIKHFFANDNTGKQINIRQIITFSKSKNKSQEQELLDFLPTVYYLIYANPGYDFSYSYTDAQIQDVDGLIFPYYICTSDCLIRISQHKHTIWVSHNPEDIRVYHEMFEVRLQHATIKPLVTRYTGIEDTVNSFSDISSYGMPTVYSPYGCAIHLVKSKELLARITRASNLPDAVYEAIFRFWEFSNNLAKEAYDTKSNCFINKDLLLQYAKDGIVHEYPKEILSCVAPTELMSLLEVLRNFVSNSQSPARYYIVKSDYFPTNNSFIIGISKKAIVSYQNGTINDYCMISDSSLVADFTYYFEEYLPNSEMVYPVEKAIEIVDECIDIVKKRISEEE